MDKDYENILQLAKEMKSNLPFSIQHKLKQIDVFDLENIDKLIVSLSRQFCLTVLPNDALQMLYPDKKICECLLVKCECMAGFKIPTILIDCRTLAEHKKGIFPNTELIDTSCYDEFFEISDIPDNYLQLRGTFHFCLLGNKEFLGSGFDIKSEASVSTDKAQTLMEKLLEIFTAKGFPYISIVEGGYKDCHDLAVKLNLKLENHRKSRCPYCKTPNKSKFKGRFKKFKNQITSKVQAISSSIKTFRNSFAEDAKADKIYTCQFYSKTHRSLQNEKFYLIVNEHAIVTCKMIDDDERPIDISHKIKLEKLLRVTSKIKNGYRVTYLYIKDQEPIHLVISSENEAIECLGLIMRYVSTLGD